MTRLIGLRCKRCKALSLQVLIGRGLHLHCCNKRPVQLSRCCAPDIILGDHGGGVPPVPIPNTAVKPSSADGTAGATLWESRSSPRTFYEPPASAGGSFSRRSF